jgi:hypothetical protein
LRFPWAGCELFGSGVDLGGGFTMSLDGGFDEFREFFVAFARSSFAFADSFSSLSTAVVSFSTCFCSRAHLEQSICFFFAAIMRLLPNTQLPAKDQFRFRERVRFGINPTDEFAKNVLLRILDVDRFIVEGYIKLCFCNINTNHGGERRLIRFHLCPILVNTSSLNAAQATVRVWK